MQFIRGMEALFPLRFFSRCGVQVLLTLFLMLLQLFFAALHAADGQLQGVFSEEVVVDLREPTYCDGVLETTQGGVVEARNLLVQAKHLSYSRKKVGDDQQATLLAEGDLSVEYGDYLFVGEKIEYDFLERRGVIYRGRAALGPWIVGAQVIFLHADGTYTFSEAFATTDSAAERSSWKLRADSVNLLTDGTVVGHSLLFYCGSLPLLWMPRLSFNPLSLTESPLHYSVGWGGKQGPRVGASYTAYSTKIWKINARLDYHLKHGLGGGIETRYHSPDKKTTFRTINYYARDITVNLEPFRRNRYRFQGIYKRIIEDKKLVIDMSYDKVSDIEMPSDYSESDLGIYAPGKTQLLGRREAPNWLATAQARVRLNSFQTMKQELPTLEWSHRPVLLGQTGCISDVLCRSAYLDYDYDYASRGVKNYHSTRFEGRWRLWRPMDLGGLAVVTPQAKALAIAYGNSRSGGDGHTLATACVGGTIISYLSRSYSTIKHSLIPYVNYCYTMRPTLLPADHFIFDIDDGWYTLNVLRVGVKQQIALKGAGVGVQGPLLSLDCYADAFFATPTVLQTIPRAYLFAVFNPTGRLRISADTAWYFPGQVFDHMNIRGEWTISDNSAWAIEYRSRSKYSWRKVDHDNFMLESYHSVEQLLHSPLSDRRDTVLLHSYWRFHPFLAVEARLRKGWHRRRQPAYSEYEANLLTSLPGYWNIKLSYQCSEGDHRMALSFSLRPPPKAGKASS